METVLDTLVNSMRDVITRPKNSVRTIAAKAGLPRRSVQAILDGHIPSVNRATEICDALGLELYIGPPRHGGASEAIQQSSETSPVAAPEAAPGSGLIRESDLSLPVLRFLAETPDGFLTTADLISQLEALFKLTDIDAEMIPGRADTRFSQKVRTIVSHRDSANNPIKKGWIDYDADARGLRITKAGRAILDSFTFGPAGKDDA